MEFSLFKTAAWQLVRQMDWIALLILIGLFCLSVFCIAIICFKLRIFRAQSQYLHQLRQRVKSSRNFSELIAASKEFKDSIGGKFLMHNLNDLRLLLDGNIKKKDAAETEAQATLASRDLEQLEASINQNIDNVLLEEEAYLPVLSASAAVAPLIGLFGTIWGLIHAFIDISQEKTADIATVAPGMAEALIITLAGLVVAIPALVAFHYFSNQIRKYELQLSEIGDTFVRSAQRAFVK